MINSKKKGFTIVELVIVIAVIAILAAVLIPTFSNLVKKANMSSDQVAVKNINTLLATEFVNEKPESLKQIIDLLDENGYDVDALEPLTEGYKFAWNKEENKIYFLTEAEAANYETLDTGSSYINEVVNTFDNFKKEIEKGKDITLSANVTEADEVIIPAGANVTLNLGGFAYTTKTSNENVAAISEYIKVSAGATLTIENGTFTGRGIMNNGTLIIKEGTTINAIDRNGGGCIKNKPGGNVIIEGGTFNVPNYIAWEEVNKGGAGAVCNEGGTVLIKGGTFNSNTEQYLISSIEGGKLTIEGGTFTAYRGTLAAESNGEIIVNGGTFKVTNGSQSGWLAYTNEDGKIVLNAGSYTTVTENTFTGNIENNLK